MPRHDDTVILRRKPDEARRRTPLVPVALGAAFAAAAAVGAFLAWQPAPPLPAPTPSAQPASPPASPPAPLALAEPIPAASEAAILAARPAVRTLARFAPNPAILVVDFPTLAEQGRMLNRLAAWVEKAGVPRDRLLDDAQLAEAIARGGTGPDTYYYGHDYRAADVRRFFALADAQGTALNADERTLRGIVARADAEPAGFGALVTIPAAGAVNGVSAPARAVILHHELSHGEYFTNPAYAAFVDTIWRTVLSEAERAAFRTYLAAESYDPALEDLMKNEFQAYLMHTPDRTFFDPDRVGIAPERLAAIRASFLAGMPPGWLRDETRLAP